MILSLLLLMPVLGCFLIYILPARARDIALGATALHVLFAIISLPLFRFTEGMQLIERTSWVSFGTLSVDYHVGVDGISYPLVLLTALLGLVAVMVSRREIHKDESAYYGLLLGLLGCVVGVFISLNLVLFFVFWEFILVLMFLLILWWGHSNRKYAAMRFLIYTGIGSAALLFAIILFALSGTLDMISLAADMPLLVFALLVFAFFVKIPIVPFHTWLPDAHVQAPTAGSIVLAGVLLKMGAYGLLRLGLPLMDALPDWLPMFLFIMGTVTLLYGAFVCLAQDDLKRLIAYSSVNHMGFVLLGIAAGSALGITGAVFEMVSHGLLSALLFGLAGLIYQKTGTFSLARLRGLASAMPRTAWMLLLAGLGAMGLPGMSGFVAEFIIFFATFKSFGLLAVLPVLGIIVTGSYVVRMLSRVVFGKSATTVSERGVSMVPFAILLIATFAIGLLPFLLLALINASPFT